MARYRNAVSLVISLHPAARVVDVATALVHAYQPYVYVIGCVPSNVPTFALTLPPARIELGTVGAVRLAGADGGSCTAAEVAEYLVTAPAMFVAVSATRRSFPASASMGV